MAGTNGAQRPQYVNAPGCTPNAVTGDINHYIMTQCFAFPAPGQLGNLGRNTLRMPVFRDLDFSVFKNQNLWGEKLKAQFRVEMFNVLNNTNLTAQFADYLRRHWQAGHDRRNAGCSDRQHLPSDPVRAEASVLARARRRRAR